MLKESTLLSEILNYVCCFLLNQNTGKLTKAKLSGHLFIQIIYKCTKFERGPNYKYIVLMAPEKSRKERNDGRERGRQQQCQDD